jgi:hypothetical protein|nr:MAG TPA: hypothetical protein [Caudoviricetes sp.]DAX49584.1 MAG TPA: hypothetical protein [Caudoviricetes sp.]
MRVEILIFLILFLIQLISILKIKSDLKKEVLYAKAILKSTEILKEYTELYINNEIQKYPNVSEFIERKFDTLDTLLDANSFNEIGISEIPKDKKWDNEKIEKMLNELKEAPENIKGIFKRLLTTNSIIFDNAKVKFLGIYISGRLFFRVSYMMFLLKILVKICFSGLKRFKENKVKQEIDFIVNNEKIEIMM